jgi:hypothetical protein
MLIMSVCEIVPDRSRSPAVMERVNPGVMPPGMAQ